MPWIHSDLFTVTAVENVCTKQCSMEYLKPSVAALCSQCRALLQNAALCRAAVMPHGCNPLFTAHTPACTQVKVQLAVESQTRSGLQSKLYQAAQNQTGPLGRNAAYQVHLTFDSDRNKDLKHSTIKRSIS